METFQDRLFKYLKDDNKDIALIDSKLNTISYAELKLKVEEKINFLSEYGYAKNHRAMLLLDKSIECVSLIMAILKIGGSYIPVDPSSPKIRLETMMEDAQPFLIFTENEEGVLKAEIQKQSKTKLPNEVNVLYTSGSTGAPKGVASGYNGLSQFVFWAQKEFHVGTNDCLVSHAPFHFDLSTFDFFVGISSGAKIWLMDKTLSSNFRLIGQYIPKINPTVWYATPSTLSLLSNYSNLQQENCPRLILFAGELFQMGALNKLRTLWDTHYYNLYGPTETNVVSYYKLPEIDLKRVKPYPIGNPCPYANFKLSDSGELWVNSKSNFISYTNEEKTNNFYKTGDVVIYDGENYHYKGRIDEMVKHSGYRVHPAEIEKMVLQIDGVKSCAVLYKEKFYAFYTGIKRSGIEMKALCSNYLLSYMIPSRFIYMEELPQNSHAKVDKIKLKHLLDEN